MGTMQIASHLAGVLLTARRRLQPLSAVLQRGGKRGLATGMEAEIPTAGRTEASQYSMRARGLAASQSSASRPIADLLHLPAKPRHVLSLSSLASFLSLLFLVSSFSFSFYYPPLHVVYKTLKTFHRHAAFGCFLFCFFVLNSRRQTFRFSGR